MAKMERQDQNSARGSILSSARIRYTGSAKTTDDMWYQFDVEDGTKRAPAMEQARPRVVLRSLQPRVRSQGCSGGHVGQGVLSRVEEAKEEEGKGTKE